jgi:hypothetical protein
LAGLGYSGLTSVAGSVLPGMQAVAAHAIAGCDCDVCDECFCTFCTMFVTVRD